MGIRPQLMLLCGIDDFKVDNYTPNDPRLKYPEQFEDRWETEFDLTGLPDYLHFMFKDRDDKRVLEIGELLHFDPEYGVSNVIGYVWDRISSQDTLYALAACMPQFNQPGYMVLPTVSKEEDISSPNWELNRLNRRIESGEIIPKDELRKILRRTHGKRMAHRFNQNYGTFGYDLDWRAPVALHVLRSAGLSVGRRDLKLMLYWQWS